MTFTHLHTHSHYSLLDGLAKIDDLVAKAKEYKMDSLALTDHGVMYGLVEFYQKCKAAGIKPILGVEVYLAPNGMENKRSKIDEERPHLVLLAKNIQGYKNLIELTSKAHLDGFYYKPRIDFDLLEKNHEGLIALTACLGGEIPSLIKNGNRERAKQRIIEYSKLFGEGNFYLEIQHHKDCKIQEFVNKEMMKLSKETGVPLVATNDIHYVEAEDRHAHDILLCLQTKKQLADKNRMNMLEFDVSFRSPEQMIKDFSYIPEAIENTKIIADICNVEIELGEIKLPYYEVPEGNTENSYLNKLCVQGLKSRYNITEEEIMAVRNKKISDEELEIRNLKLEIGEKPSNEDFIRNVIERMDYELGVINKMGFASYFLIVQDFVNWSKNNGVVVGPGRGSAAGAIVAYLLNITNVDPIKYDLLFERFLNPERISMPDIDIDFADTKREDVIRYVEKKYGTDHVAQIITFGTMAARAAIRDVGRVLAIPYDYCDRIAKMIPMFSSLNKALEIVPDFKAIYKSDSDAKKLIDMARKLEGVARHSSRHACGIVISQNKLTDYVPLQYASGDDRTIVSQYSLHPVEDLGLLKMDFLGLKNLTIIERAIKIIKRIYNDEIDIDNLPIDDEKTYELFQQGNTTGVFQFESSGMRRYLKELKPTDIEDLIAMTSLYRPGPMDLIPEYIAVKHGRKKPSYLHPFLKPILDKTYGIAVYQEQLLRIARDLAGFTLGEADVLRRAIGKKIIKLLNEQKIKFIKGCIANGIKEKTARDIFAFMEPFAGYGFNRSHAACYAIIAYQTAYLKANYPAEFMAALMTSDNGNLDKIAVEIEESVRMGVDILPPDINESYKTFTVVDSEQRGKKKIRFGLSAVKNLGENIIENIKDEREKNGKFKDTDDFVNRMNCKDFNKKSLESLIKSGSLDGFGERGDLLASVDKILAYSKNAQKAKDGGQDSLFGQVETFQLKIEKGDPVSEKDKLSWEKEFLGLYISDHPFRKFSKILQDNIVKISYLEYAKDGSTIRAGGIISTIKKIITKKNEQMMFIRLEDETGGGEVIVFPSILKEYANILKEAETVVITGKVSAKDSTNKIICNEILSIREENALDINSRLVKIDFKLRKKEILEKEIFDKNEEDIYAGEIDIGKKINIRINNKNDILKLKDILISGKGNNLVYLIVDNKKIKTKFSIDDSAEIKRKIAEIAGEGNVFEEI
ncbi:MAG: DNA polymerase III subunit alpha [bacterium]